MLLTSTGKGKKRKRLPQTVKNIDEVDLNDSTQMWVCVSNWDEIEQVGQDYLKVRDLFIDMKERWDRSNLSDRQRKSLKLYLMEGYTQKEVGDKLNIGSRHVADAVAEGIEIMSEYGRVDD